MDREARIFCKRNDKPGRRILCDTRLDSADISPSGRHLDRWSTNYRGQVVLGSQTITLPPWPDAIPALDDLDTGPMDSELIQLSYQQRTGLTGRYRVLDKIHGTGSGVITGEMVYGDQVDMKDADQVRYHFPPYLLEALMHLFAFYPAIRNENDKWNLIPAQIGEMRFVRTVRPAERLQLAARLRSQDEQGFTWDARAADENGTPIMQVRSMRMNRYNP